MGRAMLADTGMALTLARRDGLVIAAAGIATVRET